MSRFVFLSAIALFSACGPAAVPKGTVFMKFSVGDQVKTSPSLKSPLLGTVYGSIFLQEDVAVDGPRKDAVNFASVTVMNVDLRTEKTSAESYTSPGLDPGKYVFLGMLDVDGTGDDPNAGDPVTLALTNKFDIVSGMEAKRSVVFELVFN